MDTNNLLKNADLVNYSTYELVNAQHVTVSNNVHSSYINIHIPSSRDAMRLLGLKENENDHSVQFNQRELFSTHSLIYMLIYLFWE